MKALHWNFNSPLFCLRWLFCSREWANF